MLDMILFVFQLVVLPLLAMIQLIVAIYRYRDTKKHADPGQAAFWEQERKRICRSLWILGIYVGAKLIFLGIVTIFAFG